MPPGASVWVTDFPQFNLPQVTDFPQFNLPQVTDFPQFNLPQVQAFLLVQPAAL